jgi:predicted AAA+ superfamily ATPase
MKRSAYKQLVDWKNRKNRKPLIVQGARQVGKTYLVNEFGKTEYANYIYLNF